RPPIVMPGKALAVAGVVKTELTCPFTTWPRPIITHRLAPCTFSIWARITIPLPALGAGPLKGGWGWEARPGTKKGTPDKNVKPDGTGRPSVDSVKGESWAAVWPDNANAGIVSVLPASSNNVPPAGPISTKPLSSGTSSSVVRTPLERTVASKLSVG